MTPSVHEAVMLEEVLEVLRPRPGGVYIDATLGGATHTGALLASSSPDGRVLSFDVDPAALLRARETLSAFGERWRGVEANFRDLERIAEREGYQPCDGILLDLGFSSDELVDPARGLSFQQDGPLDMRLGPRANEDGLTAADIVNSWRREEIEKILREFGEERYARSISEAVVRARKAARIIGTFDLVSVIRSAVPLSYERGRLHPATRTFQALRIVVNDELGALSSALEAAQRLLVPGGRICVISFHSLEDRVVKRAFRSIAELHPLFPKPRVPTQEECERNSRARSAKLRAAEKNLFEQNKIKKYVANIRYDNGEAP
jgi:16S rRNA (cytosine1402-N4)-methyltransferase